MRRLAAADAGGDVSTDPGADLLQIDDVGAVQDGQMHDEPGGAMQLVQHRQRRGVQPVLVHCQRAKLHQPRAQLIVAAVTP
ncbi:Uncharacterised protein [Mycobacteroides abscessus]|nr:Uncharacterised protein [Mycobacteroides abscessus]